MSHNNDWWWNTHQVSIFVHSHRKRPHAHEKSVIVVINHPLVLHPDVPPMRIILQKTTYHSDPVTSAFVFPFKKKKVALVGFRCWSASHILIVVDAMLALPDLPLGEDQLIRVRDHRLWAEQQDGQQSCSQQEADMLPSWSTTAKVHCYCIDTRYFTRDTCVVVVLNFEMSCRILGYMSTMTNAMSVGNLNSILTRHIHFIALSCVTHQVSRLSSKASDCIL